MAPVAKDDAVRVDPNMLSPGVQICKKGCGLDICSGNTVLDHLNNTDIAEFAEELQRREIAHEVTKPDLLITIMPAPQEH